MKTDIKNYIMKVTVAWVVCASILVFAYLFLLFPTQRKLAYVRNRLDSIRGKYDEATEFVSGKYLDKMREQVARLETEINKYLVPGEEAKTNAFRVSQIAEQSGVKGFSTKFRTSSTATVVDNCPQVETSRIDISFQGQYKQFVRLINDFERHQPIVLVESFSIIASDKGDKLNKVKIALTILVDNRNKQSSDTEKNSTKT